MFDRGVTVLRIRGIPIRLHISLLIFLPYVAFVASTQFAAIASSIGVPREAFRLPPIAWGVILAVGLFIAILAHELAHSLVALRHGVRVRAITLMMLGGVSQMEQDDPENEAWMAFAGPLMSFGIALAAYLYRLLPGEGPLDVAFLAFAVTNALLGAFNLLPAFPMDGGRVLRGILSPHRPRSRDADCDRAGQGNGRAFGFFGLLSYNFILVLIAIFVYMGSAAEQGRLGARAIVRGLPVARLMTDRIGDAYVDEPADAVAERLLRQNLVAARVLGGLEAARRCARSAWSRPGIWRGRQTTADRRHGGRGHAVEPAQGARRRRCVAIDRGAGHRGCVRGRGRRRGGHVIGGVRPRPRSSGCWRCSESSGRGARIARMVWNSEPGGIP